MRIISQDGCYDMPYEEVALKRNGCNICALNQYLSSGFVIELAKYSTKEKAIKAMEMCREQYAQCEINKHLIQKAADNLEGVSITFTGEVRNQLADKYLFQFPADDEI